MLKFNKDAWVVFWLLALFYGYFYQDAAWNGNSRIALALATVRDGQFSIDPYVDDVARGLATGDRSFFNGHYYSDKAIGSSIIAAVVYLPIYAMEKVFGLRPEMSLVKHLITFLGLGIPSALCGSLMYLIAEYLSKSRFRAFVVTLAVSLGTISFPFSVIYFGHQQAAAVLFCAFFLVFRLKAQPGPIQPIQTFWIGFLLGFAIIIEYPAALIVALIIPYLFYILWQRKALHLLRALICPALGGLIPIGAMMLYNQAIFQNPFASGYEYLIYQPYQEGMARGFFGIGRPSLRVLFFLTFHPAVGIFWMSPVLLLAFVGAFFALRQRANLPDLLLAGLGAAGFLLMNSGYFLWWGGNSFAPRHLIPMLPFLCLPLIHVPRKAFFLVVLLGAVSIVQMTFAAAGDILAPDANLEHLKQLGLFDFSMLYSYMLPHLLDGGFSWNLGGILGLKQWISLVPLALALLAACVYMALPTRLWRGRRLLFPMLI